jgi:hypothetical protein
LANLERDARGISSPAQIAHRFVVEKGRSEHQKIQFPPVDEVELLLIRKGSTLVPAAA